MSTPFLPATLPLLPLPPPQVLFPHLQVRLPLASAQLAVVLTSLAENTAKHKLEDGSRVIGVVPVVEIERRVGRWATAARVRRIERIKGDGDVYTLVLEGLVSPFVLGL